MEIRYLEGKEKQRSRALYEEVFVEDEKAFVDAYYQIKTADNRILAAEEDGQIVSMLHRNPYAFRLRGELVAADYIVAVATKVTYRHQGLMRALLTRALRDMRSLAQPFTFLMPADEAIYTPFDFRLMGNDDEEGLAALSAAQLAEDYELFVEKDEAYARRHIDWPEWETTPMMLRLLDIPAFVRHIGAECPQSLTLRIADPLLPENDGVFRWTFTNGGSTLTPTMEAPELDVSVADLGSFLFGMLGAEELLENALQEGSAADVRADRLALRERLERIRVLDGVYINETV